jgi:hypothetical protein
VLDSASLGLGSQRLVTFYLVGSNSLFGLPRVKIVNLINKQVTTGSFQLYLVAIG